MNDERKIAALVAETLDRGFGIPYAELGARAARRIVNQDKHDKLTGALAGFPVLVMIDPRRELVSVPEMHRGKSTLTLRLGYNLTPAITDLAFTADGFSATLSFGRASYLCAVPWEAVFAFQTEKRELLALWPSSIPEDLHAATPPAPEPKRRHLSSVPEW